ncbi:Methionine aminopeptidase [Rickettsiales endosymbiont of Paramecium tredecaurelia]|uniref:type I methionyl aminopeptidase n=1 Tax=Candidatus Sarmatiella mevalonica TaxID=2770581 RepID=UPI00192069D5|nr:type I methionyl aminopeptidase [Candidatus Sarmatiella mevalonica]MBL3284509.1 Methionine aminopeptidase [Candidatus Sarmatiella mevalonica]
MSIKIHSEQDFQRMRVAGALAAKTLDFITEYVAPGVSTGKLNDLCHDFIIEHGAIPAPLNYKGFPKSICTSINHVVCHGIPSDKVILRVGQILNIDVTVIVDGWYGDSSRMFYVGQVPRKAQKLVQVTYDCMMLGIEAVKPGQTLGTVGAIIQKHAQKHGYGVVRDYTGHGIGQVFHDEPAVYHYGTAGQGVVLEEGMFFTIEPMINAGTHQTVLSPLDGWTVWTQDKSLSAQFEHTIGVTSDGYEIFTQSAAGFRLPPYK